MLWCRTVACLMFKCWAEWGFVHDHNWAPSSEFVSSSIPSWQISTAHAQPFRGARDLAFCLKVHLASLIVWASSEGSGETARMRRLTWTFAARIGDKYQIRLTRSNFTLKYHIHNSSALCFDMQHYWKLNQLIFKGKNGLKVQFWIIEEL